MSRVGVDVEGLFERLGPDYDAPSLFPALSEQLFHSPVEHRAVAGGETTVMQRRLPFQVK